MKNVSFLPFFMLLTPWLSAQEIAGDWYGALHIQGTQLRLVFHIEEKGGQYSATLDSPDQNAFGLPVYEVTYQSPDLIIRMPNLMLEYKGAYDENADAIEGTFSQGGLQLPLQLSREAVDREKPVRPQHPEPPFPYLTEEISFENKEAGITLAGALTLPDKEGPHPMVVLISGSGPQNRNEELFDHKPFLVISDYLTRRGIGVLRYDDRGVGESGGSFRDATSLDFAGDALAAVNYLRSRPEVARTKIGLIGHSEGGLIAPMVAAERPEDIAFIVLLAGPGVPGKAISAHQQKRIAEVTGQDEETIALNQQFLDNTFKLIEEEKTTEEIIRQTGPILKKLLSRQRGGEDSPDLDRLIEQQIQQLNSPWFRFFLTYDPAPALEKVKCPVLALNGEKDLQVDPEQNLPPIEAALKKGENPDYLVKKMAGLNHLFQTCNTGSPSEYAFIEETFSTDALALMAEWIQSKTQGR